MLVLPPPAEWYYAWIPVVGTLAGGAAAGALIEQLVQLLVRESASGRLGGPPRASRSPTIITRSRSAPLEGGAGVL